MTKSITELFEAVNGKKIMVIGDVMVDSYYSGTVDRISPEAPVPIVRVHEKDDRLGGAANVALNLKALGAQPIICAGIGDDVKGKIFLTLMEKRGLSLDGIMTFKSRPTTVKTRIISDGQQMMRVDEESTDFIDPHEENEMIAKFETLIDEHNIEAVIFEDYNKGLLTERLIEKTIEICREKEILTAVDPKKDNFFAFKGCGLFKPNLKEVREGLKQEILNVNIESMLGVANDLRTKLEHKYTLLTLSEKGVFFEEKNHHNMIPAHQRKIADVSGAGDTVIATATLFLAAGADIELAANLSNLAGGMVCESVGVIPIDKNRLLEEALQLVK